MKKYKSGDIGKEDQELLEKYINDGVIELEDIEDLHELHQSIELEEREASPELRSGVYQLISNEKQKMSQPRLLDALTSWMDNLFTSNSYRLAYSITILLVGGFVGWLIAPTGKYHEELSSLNGELREMKAIIMISMLENSSASERLKGVTIGYELGADAKVIEALINTLNYDDNVNVRLAALEALEPYASNSEVRMGLVTSIKYQDSPMVQLSLAELMVRLQDKNAVKEFQELINTKDIEPEVKAGIEENLNLII